MTTAHLIHSLVCRGRSPQLPATLKFKDGDTGAETMWLIRNFWLVDGDSLQVELPNGSQRFLLSQNHPSFSSRAVNVNADVLRKHNFVNLT